MQTPKPNSCDASVDKIKLECACDADEIEGLCAQQVKDRLHKLEPRGAHGIELVAKLERGEAEPHKTLGRVRRARKDKELDHRHDKLVHLHDIGRCNNTRVVEVGRNIGFDTRT